MISGGEGLDLVRMGGLPAASDHRLQFGGDLATADLRRESCRQHLHQLQAVAPRPGGDGRAAIGSQDDEAFGLQPAQRLPDRNPGDSVLLGESVLDESFACLETPGDDRLTQLVGDHIPPRVVRLRGADHGLRIRQGMFVHDGLSR
jgi:hypothetical protein